MSYDSLLVVLALIGILSAVFFILGLASDVIWPLIEGRKPRRQATYRN